MTEKTDLLQGPAGNYYDKFGSQNRIVRHLMAGFMSSFEELISQTKARTALEIGCGEGHMLAAMTAHGIQPLHGFDLDEGVVRQARLLCPNAHITLADGHQLAYPDNAFDLVIACEVLEHVWQPARVLAEAARVSRRYALFSVPREPIWRILNMARGKYWRNLGNTPGHIQHWSTRRFAQLLNQHFEVLAIRQPLPWTMALCALRD